MSKDFVEKVGLGAGLAGATGGSLGMARGLIKGGSAGLTMMGTAKGLPLWLVFGSAGAGVGLIVGAGIGYSFYKKAKKKVHGYLMSFCQKKP